MDIEAGDGKGQTSQSKFQQAAYFKNKHAAVRQIK